ncbi:branched-chain amino acid ABC transporter substrate-binding protein [Aquitalea denitrificans]|uniref:branched-chain amino acid ABC transporter substrate-binding protein n=1 Tax=Aquitalea denitrificans TaxID=519081 RepID=UPI001F116311|nr:branched-chain amino acid ABC transporter substrate-binding protein [Aquitalea denitrificans]
MTVTMKPLYCSLLLATACTLSVPAFAADEQVVKIGLTGPLTGPQAATGKDDENGARMALDYINAQGLVIAGKKTRFELMSEDDSADPRTGMSVAQRFVDANVSAVLGPYNSGVAIPISKLLNDAQIVMATVASNPRVTLNGYPYVFRIGNTDSQSGTRMATFAAKNLKVKKFAVIDDRTAYGQGLADEFEKAAKANGIQIATREYTNDKATEFTAILTKIKGLKVDGVFYAGYHAQGGPLRKQMAQLGMDNYLLGGDGICNEEMLKLGGKAVDDKVYCPQGGPVLEQSNVGKTFNAAYKKRFNSEPLTYAASMYDGLILLAKAMQKANSTDPKKYKPVLAAFSYQGVAGSYAFDDKHDLKNSPISVYAFRNGQLVALN